MTKNMPEVRIGMDFEVTLGVQFEQNAICMWKNDATKTDTEKGLQHSETTPTRAQGSLTVCLARPLFQQ